MTYECVKTIEKFGVKLKELNYLYGIDFQNFKTIRVYKGKGHEKLTLSKLYKKYNLSGKNLNLLVIKQLNRYYNEKQNKLVQLIEQTIFAGTRHVRSFSTFCYQYEIKDALKDDNAEYILIIVDKEQLKRGLERVRSGYNDIDQVTLKAFFNDTENLLRVQKHGNLRYDFKGDGVNKNIGAYNCDKKELNNYLTNYTGTWSISIIKECLINNIKFDLDIGGYLNIKNIHDYIDKSGYNVHAKREKLQKKLLKQL